MEFHDLKEIMCLSRENWVLLCRDNKNNLSVENRPYKKCTFVATSVGTNTISGFCLRRGKKTIPTSGVYIQIQIWIVELHYNLIYPMINNAE